MVCPSIHSDRYLRSGSKTSREAHPVKRNITQGLWKYCRKCLLVLCSCRSVSGPTRLCNLKPTSSDYNFCAEHWFFCNYLGCEFELSILERYQTRNGGRLRSERESVQSGRADKGSQHLRRYRFEIRFCETCTRLFMK